MRRSLAAVVVVVWVLGVVACAGGEPVREREFLVVSGPDLGPRALVLVGWDGSDPERLAAADGLGFGDQFGSMQWIGRDRVAWNGNIVDVATGERSCVACGRGEYFAYARDGRVFFTEGGALKVVSRQRVVSTLIERTDSRFIAQVALSPDDNRLVLTVRIGERPFNLFTATTDGRAVRQLTHEPLLASYPSWGRTGRILYLTTDYRDSELSLPGLDDGYFIKTIRANGKRPITVRPQGIDGLKTPSWSVDGRWILFANTYEGDAYRATATGGGLTRIYDSDEWAYWPIERPSREERP